MFDKIADIIARRHKWIVIFWIAALILAVPLASGISDSLDYDSDTSSSDLGSTLGQKYIDEHFGSTSVEASSIIVIAVPGSSDRTIMDNQTRELVYSIEDGIQKAVADGRIDPSVQVTSIYSFMNEVAFNYMKQLNEAYYEANQTAWVIYGIPDEFRASWMLINASYQGSFHEISAQTKVVFDDQIKDELSSLPAEQAEFVQAYADVFYSIWNSSTSVPDDQSLQTMIDMAIQASVQNAPDEATKAALLGLSELGYDGWKNDTEKADFLVDYIVAGLQKSEGVSVPAQIVYEAAGAGEDPGNESLRAMSEEMVRNSSVEDFPLPLPSALISNFVSADNTTELVTISFSDPASDSAGRDAVPVIREIVNGALQGDDEAVAYVTGTDPIYIDTKDSNSEDLKRIDPVTIVLVLVLVGLFFRSFVSSTIPPALIGIAIGISFALVFLISTYIVGIYYSVQTMMITTMLGAGCDYCIFILSRYREERLNGLDKERAVRTAVMWAGESITTSGATVIIGFGVLAFGRVQMMQSLGIALAIGISIALLISLTLLPSILMLAGDRAFWPCNMEKVRKHRDDNRKRTSIGYFSRAAKFSLKHAKAIVLAAVLISLPTTYVVATMETSYDTIEAMPDVESKQGLEAMTDGFGGGRIQPTYVAMNVSAPLVDDDGRINIAGMNEMENITTALFGIENVQQIIGPTRPFGEVVDYSDPGIYDRQNSSTYGAMMNQMDASRTSVLLTVIFATEPLSQESIDGVNQIISMSPQLITDHPSIQAIYVTGESVSTLEMSEMVQSDFGTMVLLTIGGIFVVLLIVMGSAVSPLKLILTILLSVSWTLAITSIVFTQILGIEILWIVPLLLTITCLGLGMDYDIFLTTRIIEEVKKGKNDNDAIVHAVEQTGMIITACGLIMAFAFGTMMLSNGDMFREFGFALMFAILLDATIVRIYLVPAIMSLLGKWNWWAPRFIKDFHDRRIKRGQKHLALTDPLEVSVEVDEGGDRSG